MDRLKISPVELKNVGNQIKINGEEFVSLLNEIKSHNDNLQASWKGEDAIKYTNKIEEQAKTMNKLADAIDDIGTFLVQISIAYESAKEEAMNSLK